MVPSVYFGFFCLQVSSVSNFCPDTRGRRSLVQSCCGEGGTLQTNITGMCGECSQCLGCTGFAPTHGVCAFPDYTAQSPGCSAGELSEVGPGLHALPRSKPLRFRFSGTPQRWRLGWACVLCPSQVRAAQATRCLASTLSSRSGGRVASYHLPCPSCSVFWVYSRCTFSGVPCVSSGELISGCWPSQQMSTIQNPRSWLVTGSLIALIAVW